jgi:hypothetical protein
MVDALRQAALEHLRLQAALEEVLDLERKHVIETHARLVEHTDAHEAADEGVALEEALGVLVVELEQLTRGTPNLGQDERNTPDLALVAEAVFARELFFFSKFFFPSVFILYEKGRTHLELGVEARGLERPAGDLVSMGQRLFSTNASLHFQSGSSSVLHIRFGVIPRGPIHDSSTHGTGMRGGIT